jgi:hypothetical protein
MAITPEVWFGTNDMIYTQNRTINSSLNATDSMKLDFGLSDMAELPGQSSIYVNKLHFKLTIFMEDPDNTSYQEGKFVAGIVPRDAVNLGFETVKDFQDYMAWPLKGVGGYNMTSPGAYTGNGVSNFSFTYTPRRVLLINREQNIIFTYTSGSGPEVSVMISCYGQFKRAN